MDEQKLKDIYYDAETGLGSVDKLYRAAKEFGFTRKHVQAFVKKQSLNQIFKPVGKRTYFPIWSSVDGSYFADLIFYPKAAKITQVLVQLCCSSSVRPGRLILNP